MAVLCVAPVFGACTISTSSLPGANITWQPATNISQTIATSGCAAPSFSISAGSLPPGLSLASGTGIISGVGTNAGAYPFTVSVADANGNPSQAYSWTITAVYPVFTFSSDHTQVCVNYGNGTTHCAYRQNFPPELPSSTGTIRWVDANSGSDSNPCSQASPCATIGHAYGLSAAGDLVYVNPGTYQEQLTFNAAGSAGHPIVVTASPGNMWRALVKRSDAQIQANADVPVITIGSSGNYNTINGLLIQGSKGSQYGSDISFHEVGILATQGMSGLVITNNVTYNGYHCGLKFDPGVASAPAVLDGNISVNNGLTGNIDDHGIYISVGNAGEQGITLTRNVVMDNSGAGIQLYAGSAGPPNAIVTSNFAYNNGSWGIITNGSNGLYQYNELVNTARGLVCFRVGCTGNTFIDNLMAFNATSSYTEDTQGGVSPPGPNTNDYNTYYTQAPSGSTNFVSGAHNQTTNPNVQASGSADYRLTLTTPVVRSLTSFLQPLVGGTITVTSPTAASTQSGTITFTSTLLNLPAAAAVQYVLNDFVTLGTVQGGPIFSFSWNAGWALDGPAQVKAIAYDATGAAIATSANVAFPINNRGNTVTVSSPSGFPNPGTVSGTITLTDSGSAAGGTVSATECTVNGMEIYGGGGYVSGLTFDTTAIPNGPAYFDCHHSLPGSGDPGHDVLPRIQFQFAATTSNGHTLMAVRPDITDIVMVVGGPACTIGSVTGSGCGSYQLAPVLAYTDGTTGSGSFTYSALQPCVPPDPAAPAWWKFPCTSGLANPFTNAQGNAAATVSGTGLITAVQQGETFAIISSGGKTAYVPIAVRQYGTVPHFGKDGTILHAYDPAKSIFRSSVFNTGVAALAETARGVNYGTEYAKAFTSMEDAFFASSSAQCPHAYASFATWLADWTNNFLNPITANLAFAPGVGFIGQMDACGNPQDLNDLAQGPSASWSPSPPLTYALNQLKALPGGYHGTEILDEADANKAASNPIADYKMSNGSIAKIVSNGSTCTIYGGPNSINGGGTVFGFNVVVQGATTAGLNGTRAVTHKYCPQYQVWMNGACPSGNTPPAYDTTDIACTAASGTYTNATDPNLEVLTMGDTTNAFYGVYAGENPRTNHMYADIVAQFTAAGVPYAWPTFANSGWDEQIGWIGSGMATYSSIYWAPQVHDAFSNQGFGFGLSWMQYRNATYNRTWGCPAGPMICSRFAGGYWQNGSTGYVHEQQDVPHSIITKILGPFYYRGGRAKTISGFSGSVMTTTTPHGIGYPQNNVIPWVKCQISGNTDAAVNGNLYCGLPTGPNTIEVYNGYGSSGCAQGSGSATAVIRGVSYTIASASSSPFLSPVPPLDLVPGEHVAISGNGVSCYNKTWVVASVIDPARGWIGLGNPVNSAGTGGTVKIVDDHDYPDPTYEYITSNDRHGAAQVSSIAAMIAGYAAHRLYLSWSRNVFQNGAGGSFPNDDQENQTPAMPFPDTNIEIQRQWWAWAQAGILEKRIAPFDLQMFLPSPNLGDPWIECGARTSSLGKMVLCVNFSEAPVTTSINLANYQTGTNPISVYRMSYPNQNPPTDLLTGAQGTVAYTFAGGETIAWLAHSGAVSYVQPAVLTFNPPAGATKMAVKFGYVYAQPLAESTAAVVCNSSPCTVNIDPGLNNAYMQRTYLDAANNVISVGDVEIIRPGPVSSASGVSPSPRISGAGKTSGTANIN